MTDLSSNFSIKRWPEGERPREKLIQFGAESLTDAELLAKTAQIKAAIEIGKRVRRQRALPVSFDSADTIAAF